MDPSTNRVNENISAVQRFQKGGKEARLKEEVGGGGRGGQKGWLYRRLLPAANTQMLQDFTLGLQKREDLYLALSETRPDQKRTRIQTRNQTRTRI